LRQSGCGCSRRRYSRKKFNFAEHRVGTLKKNARDGTYELPRPERQPWQRRKIKMRSLVAALLSLAVMAGTALAQMARKGADAEPPPLETVLAGDKTANNTQLAELIAVNSELPLGPADVLKEYEQGMALIAQGMSADVVNISRAQEANQITREQAEYLIQERYQIAMMQYQVLSALHEALERDVAQEATRAQRARSSTGPDTAVVVQLPSSTPSAEAK
jgi:hypothetical protein